MDARGMRVPGRTKPLIVGMLSHASLRNDLRNFVRTLLLEHREACTPLHAPRAGIVEEKWRPLDSFFHSFRKLTSRWCEGVDYPCVCAKYRHVLPSDAFSHDGHVAVSGYQLVGLPDAAALAISSNSRETMYPSQRHFSNHLRDAVSDFWNANGIGSHPWGGDVGLRDWVCQRADAQRAFHSRSVSGRQHLN